MPTMKKKIQIKELEPFCRSLTLKNSPEIKEDDRTITFPFSSELPVERWFGLEILSHSEECIDFSRINNKAALLDGHEWNKQIGVIEKAWLGEDKRLYATARFSKQPAADAVFQDIIDGIRTHVSFGYRVNEMMLESTKDDKETYRVTSWMPFEISFVSVPADPTVGIGRSASHAEKNQCRVLSEVEDIEDIEVKKEKPLENIKMEKEVKEEKVNIESVREDARRQASEILAMGREFQMVDAAIEAVNANRSINEFKDIINAELKKRNAELETARKNQEIGLTDKEKRNFSFIRAIAAQANPGDRRIQDTAAFEREVSQAYSKKIGKDARGMWIPPEVLGHREFNLTTGKGSNTVATNLLAGSFIEALDNALLVKQLGATVLNGLVGNVAIPKHVSRSTAYWIDTEAGGITAGSNPVIDQVTLSPKSVGDYTDISRSLLLQSSIDIEALVRNDLAKTLAVAIDLAALSGTGLNGQPKGVINQDGIGGTDWDTANTPSWAKIVGLETDVATENALLDGSFAYIMNASMAGSLKSTPKEAGYPVYLADNKQLNGYPFYVTNQLAAGQILFGKFSDILIGLWGGIDLHVNTSVPELDLRGAIRVRILQDIDTNIRRAESFSLGANPAGS